MSRKHADTPIETSSFPHGQYLQSLFSTGCVLFFCALPNLETHCLDQTTEQSTSDSDVLSPASGCLALYFWTNTHWHDSEIPKNTQDSQIPCIGGGWKNHLGNDLEDSISLRSKIKTSRNSGQGRHQGHRHQPTARHSSARCPRPRCCAPGIELKRYHAPMCIPINRPICVALGSVGHQPFSLPAPKLLWGS